MSDLTPNFRSILAARQKASASQHGHHGVNDHTTAKTSHPILSRKRTRSIDSLDDAFLKEGYRLLEHIHQLHYFLSRVQKYYLKTASAASLLDDDDEDDGVSGRAGTNGKLPLLEMLPKLKHMTDGDRQALDTQIQTVVAGLFNRTAALGKIAEETAGTSGVISTLFANKEEAFRARLLQEHRRAIVWLLQKRLMDVSLIQKRMQERLLKMKTQSQESFLYSSKSTPTSTLHKSPHSTSSTFLPFALSIPSTITSAVTATLSSTSSKLPKSTTAPSPAFPRSSTTSSPGRASTTSPARPSTTSLSPSRLASTTFSPGDEEDVRPQEEEDVAKSLTAQERMLLENDNVELLESLESSLDQVRHTTTLLMEISSLHSRLAHEVTQQATTIDTLYEESWRHTETVTKANVQLQSAQRRFAGARVWVLIFLVMASGVLGFLDYYG